MAKEAPSADQFDAPWTVAVERLLQPMLQLCFPAVHETIDWRQAPEFLDTELQQLGPEHEQGGRTVDKLVKVRRIDGQEQRLFLHIEIQAQPVAAMEEGRVEALMEGILSALETRFGTVPEGLRTQLKELRDESRLRHAMRLAVTEPTLDRFQARF